MAVLRFGCHSRKDLSNNLPIRPSPLLRKRFRNLESLPSLDELILWAGDTIDYPPAMTADDEKDIDMETKAFYQG